jgi:AAA family ATP:ADP antiporter
VTATFAQMIGPAYLLLVSIVFLELGVQCVYRVMRASGTAADSGDESRVEAEPVGARAPSPLAAELAGTDPESEEAAVLARRGTRQRPLHDALNGIRLVLRSSYLQTICAFTFCYTLSSTFVYFLQAHIVDAAITDPAEQAAWFGRVDLAVNVLTALGQVFLTGRIVATLGIGLSLAVQPLIAVAAFACLGFSPQLAVLAVFQVLLRSVHHATAKPAREMLFTVVGREVKYKAKSFIDTFVYRGGDTLGAWAFDFQQARMGLGLHQIAFIGVPIAVVWAIVGARLGRKQDELAREHARATAISGSR